MYELQACGHTLLHYHPCAYLNHGSNGQRGGGGGGALPSNGLLEMCRWMGSHFHDLTDYNGVAFSSIFNRVTRMGSHFFGTFRVRKSFAQK